MRLPNALSRLILLSLLIVLPFSKALAVESVLCTVTSDLDKEVGKVVYEMDEELRVIKHLYKERYVDNKLVERVELDPRDLLGDGIILHKKDKYVTVRLYSHNFDVSSGGILYLDTLYSGLSGQRKEYVIEVRMDESDKAVMTYNKQPFSRMHFVAKRSPILGPIGIEKVNFMK